MDDDEQARGTDIVRAGYDAIAPAYLETQATSHGKEDWLDEVFGGLPDGAAVLDAGCGPGIPVARALAERFAVTGVDISEAQVALARKHVPDGRFVQGDLARLDMPDASFDGIVALYSIIHVPRERHSTVLAGFHRMLKPGGPLLLTAGVHENPAEFASDWMGLGQPMFWSHFDAATTLRLLDDVGFDLLWQRTEREPEAFGDASHLIVSARRRA